GHPLHRPARDGAVARATSSDPARRALRLRARALARVAPGPAVHARRDGGPCPCTFVSGHSRSCWVRSAWGRSSDPRPVHGVRELGISFPILLDPDLGVGKAYRVRGLPTSFVVDRDGVVRFREVGYRDWTDRESQFVIDEALRAR